MKVKWTKTIRLNILFSIEVFTVGVHVIPWHLRWGQALSEGVHVIVRLLQGCESHLLWMLLGVGVRGPQAVHLRGQSATRGRYGTQEGHKRFQC